MNSMLNQLPTSIKNDSLHKKITEFDFDDMQIKVGDKLHLRLHSNAKNLSSLNNAGYSMSTVIGYVPNHSFIVTMPKTNQLIGQPLLEGDQILVLLFSGQCVFSFKAFVDKVIRQPFQYLHLSIPKHILGQTVRKSRRIKTVIEADAMVDNKSIPLIITNLSDTGAEISSQSELGKVGTNIKLLANVEIHEKEISMQLQSIIRSVKPMNKQGKIRHGVEFTGLQAEQIFSLRSFIYQELIENPNSDI